MLGGKVRAEGGEGFFGQDRVPYFRDVPDQGSPLNPFKHAGASPNLSFEGVKAHVLWGSGGVGRGAADVRPESLCRTFKAWATLECNPSPCLQGHINKPGVANQARVWGKCILL